MKLTLIQPCLSVSDRYGKALGKVGPTCEPMGLAFIAAAVREANIADVEIIDAAALNYSETDLISHLQKSKPDIVGISILTPMYVRAQETIAIVKKTLEKAIIIVGGPHVTVFPEITLNENNDIDIAVFGEAEQTIVELINHFKGKGTLKGIKGIAYKAEDKVYINEARPLKNDIDNLPLPARDLLPMKSYKPAPTYFKKLPSYLILASRGCPFNCAYCSKVSGKIYRKHSIKRIITEMKLLIDEYGAKDIIFRDDTFTVDREHVIKLCNEIIKEGINKKIEWSCMTRVNLVDKELLELMKKAGCWSIHYGVESGNQRLLDLIDKGITLEQVKKAFKLTREAGIEIKAFFMLGLPTETKEESMKTIEFSKEIDPDWVQFTITTPYPGTKLYDITKKDHTLKSFKWENYQTWAGWSDKELVYVPEGRDEKELKELQKYAMRSFYLRPKFILRQIKYLGSLNRIKAYMAGAKAIINSAVAK
jgi:radical SAM superfamily enzyme YgiQ (UPF0313 family)